MNGIKQDIERLLHNQRNLLDIMPEMVLLVHGGNSVEYMNPSAIRFFGDLRTSPAGFRTKATEPDATDRLFDIIQESLNRNQIETHQKIHLNDTLLECFLAPFEGYKGDLLHWLFLRDQYQKNNSVQCNSHSHDNIDVLLLNEMHTRKGCSPLKKPVSRERNLLRDDLDYPEGTMVGSSRLLQELRELVDQVAASDATILITGESGTGKELVANMIREASNRSDKPFLKINCNTINDSILESDLFGCEKGAFTGADSKRIGKFEVVDSGTIFLDEIGDISPRMQAALLRVLQDGEVIRVGGNSPTRIDVRVIAATNMDLIAAVHSGSFRLDLFYRLNIINIDIPPLRQRKEDIVDLVSHFICRYRRLFKKDITTLPQSIVDRLLEHDWPGNVRELENVIQRAVLMAKSDVITEKELFFDTQPQYTFTKEPSYLHGMQGMSLQDMMTEIEREIISHTLQKNEGKVAVAAQLLQIGKTAMYDKMKRYGISLKYHR